MSNQLILYLIDDVPSFSYSTMAKEKHNVLVMHLFTDNFSRKSNCKAIQWKCIYNKSLKKIQKQIGKKTKHSDSLGGISRYMNSDKRHTQETKICKRLPMAAATYWHERRKKRSLLQRKSLCVAIFLFATHKSRRRKRKWYKPKMQTREGFVLLYD